jgi:ethanolamine utilization protein EutQ (cupin superfamily)
MGDRDVSAPEPQVIAMSSVDAEPLAGSGARLARLVTKASHGADLLFGMAWLPPGESMAFTLEAGQGASQEVYFVLAGRIRIDWPGGSTQAEAHDTVFFPSGQEYTVVACAGELAQIAYAVVPPPR